ncbi:cation transporter [Devosia ginsengisoli]|uniref:cation transporter n=1 Tax=Devosia ginsengisoli TaxID=400770 RepID=UPI0026EE9EB7|nr:cation transporter [Devosia ginsengisoli]MCR6656557.1 cation transporter [Opitutus sp.]MCR6670996.1 cation transporter [Devosia ginsengisoli]
MSAHCCDHHATPPKPDIGAGHRLALWLVLAINGAMFLVEISAGLLSGSAALQADSLDFLADTANYGISLFVVGMALHVRARAALVKTASMLVFGVWVLGVALWHAMTGTLPEVHTMGIVGATALVANAASFGILWRFRAGDSNMRSAWICTRNDVVGNIAVLLAALGVFGTGTAWPDIAVAAIMALLAIQGAATLLPQALAELRATARTDKPSSEIRPEGASQPRL